MKVVIPHRRNLEAAKIMHQKMLNNGTFPSCLNCDHFTTPVCSIYKVTPPPEIIVFSCEQNWVEVIPF